MVKKIMVVAMMALVCGMVTPAWAGYASDCSAVELLQQAVWELNHPYAYATTKSGWGAPVKIGIDPATLKNGSAPAVSAPSDTKKGGPGPAVPAPTPNFKSGY